MINHEIIPPMLECIGGIDVAQWYLELVFIDRQQSMLTCIFFGQGEIADIITMDTGKTTADALGSVQRGLREFVIVLPSPLALLP